MKKIIVTALAIFLIGTQSAQASMLDDIKFVWNRLFGGQNEEISLGAATSTITQNLFVKGLVSCNTIDTNSAGLLACGTDEGGAGSGITSLAGVATATINLVAGTNITISSTTNSITINSTGGSGAGSVTTSSAITANHFPFWTAASGTLSGTSTLSISGTTLNATGTITQSGVAVHTTATGAAQATTISAGGLLTGGGDLSTNRTITFASSSLGLGTASVQNVGAFLQVANNGSDIAATSTFRTNLGLGDSATLASSTWLKVANNLSDLNSTSTARTNLGLAIGTNVQAYDADLTTYAGITPSANVQTLLGAADYAAFKTSLSLNNVENTALSTWAGTSNITTLGTITTGTWTGTDIAVNAGGTGTSTAPFDLSILTGEGGAYAQKTLTAGSNITITTSTGAITITGSAGGGSGSITTSTAVTAGYIPQWGTTSALTGTSTIFASSSRIGIGSISPSSTLHVIGDVQNSGVVISSLGAVGAPTFTFGGDLNTGIWSATADTLNFSTGGSERARFTSTGLLGVGTVSPSTTLHVVGGLQVTATTTLQGQTTIDNLYLGASTFANDAGQVTWADLPVSTAVATSTVESYIARIDGNALMTLYSTAVGNGTVTNLRVGVNTTVPSSTFHVVGDALVTATTTIQGKLIDTAGNAYVTSTAAAQYPIQFIIENPSAAENNAIFTFRATSTITGCYGVNKAQGDSVTFNLGYSTSRATATTSLMKVNTASTTINATTTPTAVTINGSSTPGTANPLIFFTTAASSSQFSLTCYYTTP